MIKFYIIIDTYDNIIESQLEYIFYNNIIKILTKQDLVNNNYSYEYLIFFTKFLYPTKTFIDDLINIINDININFLFLSECNSIYFVRKCNIKISNNIIDIVNETNYNILFHSNNYNKLEHIIPESYINSDYIKLLKLKDKSYDHIINYNIAFTTYEIFLKHIVKDKFCYNIILFIDNINQLNFNLPKYEFYRITIFHKFRIHEDLDKIKAYCSKFNIISCFYIKNHNNYFFNILIKRLLWFEKNIFILDTNLFNDTLFNDTLLNDLNIYHEYKKNIIFDNMYSIDSSDLVKITYFSFNKIYDLDKNTIYNLIKYYICDNCFNDTYFKLTKSINTKYKLIYNNIHHTENNLLTIRNYNFIIDNLNKELKINLCKKKFCELILKKVSLSVLCKPEKEIIDDINIIINSTDNIEFLNTLLLLFSNIKNKKIMNKLYIKILKLASENKSSKISNLCLQKLLSPNMGKDEFITVLYYIEFLIKNGTTLPLKDIIITLFLNMGQFVNNDTILEKFNNIVSNIFNINDILDIKNILSIKIENNSLPILYFLLSVITNFSPYYKTFDEFIEKRNKIKENLEYLLDNISNIPPCTLKNIIILPISNFYLSYQGIPSVDIFKLKSQLIRKICPDLNYNFKYKKNINKKINICFHSNFLSKKHSVYKDRHQIIKGLSEYDEFNVYISTFENLNEDIKYSFGSKLTHIKIDTINLLEIKDIFEKLNLDILVYCEIGMDQRSYYMAHFRLANIQINTWGHSDSCGIDTIDYFISSKLYELPYEQAQLHYSEKLILLDSLCTCYISPISHYNINTFKSRYDFGFTDEITIFFCAQSLFKFNPKFDDYIIKILQHNKNFVLIILNNDDKIELIKRFNYKNIFSQVHIFPGMTHISYLNLMHISDIILDPYPFGGCNSSFEAFSLNKVVITHPTNMINGCFTSGFYKKMGLSNLITYSQDEYVNFAIKLADDKKYRIEIENLIKEKNKVLFNDQESIIEWKNFLLNVKEKYK